MTFFPSNHIPVSGLRFAVTYLISGSPAEARAAAEEICLEQSVELPDALVPAGDLRQKILGQVEDFHSVGESHQAVISYPLELTDFNLPQLLNVIYGNTSMKSGVRVVDLDLPPELLRAFPGPRFGAQGLRRLIGEPEEALLGTALKPLGFSARQIAEFAYQFALGGLDVIKDDHNLANQPFAPFRERVQRCVEAVEKANRQKRSRKTLYVPNITAPAGEVQERAHFAQQAGAGGLELAPGLCGWEALRQLASDRELNLPLFCHPALLGTYWVSAHTGISLGVILGQIGRLAGADVVICTSYGGRFPTTRADVLDLVQKCAREMGEFPTILPSPGGGMTVEKVPELLNIYGNQVILLISGALFALGPDLAENCRRFRDAIPR